MCGSWVERSRLGSESTMQRETIMREIVHRVIENKRHSEWVSTIYCHCQRICRILCEECTKKKNQLIFCRLCQLTIKNALDGGEMRTFRLYPQSPSCVRQQVSFTDLYSQSLIFGDILFVLLYFSDNLAYLLYSLAALPLSRNFICSCLCFYNTYLDSRSSQLNPSGRNSEERRGGGGVDEKEAIDGGWEGAGKWQVERLLCIAMQH